MLSIRGYQFDGPYPLGTSFKNLPGIYVIYTTQNWLDVGETDKLGDRLNGENHERKPQWLRCCAGNQINIAFLHVSDSSHRLMLESRLRQDLCPLCGER